MSTATSPAGGDATAPNSDGNPGVTGPCGVGKSWLYAAPGCEPLPTPSCEPTPPPVFSPYCGCDGKTYGNIFAPWSYAGDCSSGGKPVACQQAALMRVAGNVPAYEHLKKACELGGGTVP